MDNGKDGNHPEPRRYDGRKIKVDGHEFDIPSWLSDDEFVRGLRSGDDENPLSSLVSLEHIEGSDDDGLDGESYHAAFLIPEGCSRRLCYPDVVFSKCQNYQDIEHEITPDGLLVRFDVFAPDIISDVHAHFYRDDEDGRESLASEFEEFADSDESGSDLSEQIDGMEPGECADLEDWDDGYIDRVHTDHGDFVAVVCGFED